LLNAKSSGHQWRCDRVHRVVATGLGRGRGDASRTARSALSSSCCTCSRGS